MLAPLCAAKSHSESSKGSCTAFLRAPRARARSSGESRWWPARPLTYRCMLSQTRNDHRTASVRASAASRKRFLLYGLRPRTGTVAATVSAITRQILEIPTLGRSCPGGERLRDARGETARMTTDRIIAHSRTNQRSAMTRRSATSHINAWRGSVTNHGAAAVTLLLVSLACFGLAACGASSGASFSPAGIPVSTHPSVRTSPVAPGRATSARAAARAHRRELATLRRLVRCVRERGFDLPEPNASGRINIRGVDVHSPRYRPAVVGCIHELAGNNQHTLFK